uniref:Uncharacterized protein n=1 Tax=Rhizophora mucronata TaxID=61149 RepID=A0A2P2NLF4_RHIMU
MAPMTREYDETNGMICIIIIKKLEHKLTFYVIEVNNLIHICPALTII